MKLVSFLFSMIIFSNCLFAQRGHSHSSYNNHSSRSSNGSYHYHYKSSVASTYHRKNYNYNAPRDSHGRIKRSSSARHSFMKTTGYPQGRKGYVIDHIIPLKEGGCDCPSNMQWQTKEAAKEKDQWEHP